MPIAFGLSASTNLLSVSFAALDCCSFTWNGTINYTLISPPNSAWSPVKACSAVIHRHYSRCFLFTVLAGVLIGNTIEAGADIGGIAASLNLVLHIPIGVLVVVVGLGILALQIWGSYSVIDNLFRVLALALLAYVASVILAHPDAATVLRGSFIPTVHFNKDFLAIIVAIGLNFFGINPMKALVLAGVVQGFSTPPLMLLIMLMTNNQKIMGQHINARGINTLGWITTAVIFAASVGLVISWLV